VAAVQIDESFSYKQKCVNATRSERGLEKDSLPTEMSTLVKISSQKSEDTVKFKISKVGVMAGVLQEVSDNRCIMAHIYYQLAHGR
jgi:hypothetical protein